MNTTKGICGHTVWAVGAPGSTARKYCEEHLCESCAASGLRLTILGRKFIEIQRDDCKELIALDGEEITPEQWREYCGIVRERAIRDKMNKQMARREAKERFLGSRISTTTEVNG